MKWYNEPPNWSNRNGIIKITTGLKTDFWRKTHYNFIRDNGHFYYQEITGNFQIKVKIIGEYHTLYDQAGLMLRLDETTWLKCGIEFVNGVQQASVVVTRNYSDWSVVPLNTNPPMVWLRLKRQDETVEVSYSLNDVDYQMLRLAYLTKSETIAAGLMVASPEREGLNVTFENLEIVVL